MWTEWTCSRRGKGPERIYTEVNGKVCSDNEHGIPEIAGTFKAIHVDMKEAHKHVSDASDLINDNRQGWHELYPYLRYSAPKNFLYLQEVRVQPHLRRMGIMRRIITDLAGTWANEEIVIYPEPLDSEKPVEKDDLIMWYENVGFSERRFWDIKPTPGYQASVMVRAPC